MVANTTTNRLYQLPDATNNLDSDVLRLIAAFNAVDADMASLFMSMSGKASVSHTHVTSEITGLDAALAGKASSGHTHAFSSLSDVNMTGVTNGQFVRWNGTTFAPVTFDGSMVASGTVAAARLGAHGHATTDVTGLDAALAAKQPLDADLTAIAALAGTSGFLKKTAANTWTLDTTVLGTAAELNVGTGANQVVQLTAAAKLPAVDGSLLTNLPAAGGFKDVKFITSSGTYTPTAGTTKILVYAQGGGGAGGNSNNTDGHGGAGGGGAGGCAVRAYTVAAQTFTCTVGGAGGTTTFTDGTTSISGNGGSQGSGVGYNSNLSEVSGGNGGGASGGTINLSGDKGHSGLSNNLAGNGGRSALGGSNSTGQYGGGGKGAGLWSQGFAGGAGCIMILEY